MLHKRSTTTWQYLRKTSDVPIIMVTGRDDILDRVVGLEIGADYYITKPFHVREVLARIRSVLRRVRTTAAEQQTDLDESAEAVRETSAAFRFDDMVIIPDQFELFCRDGTRCDLTSGDFKLLNAFLQNPKRVLSRDHLMDLAGGAGWNPLGRTIDNQVARLRKKIERNPADPRIIKTVRGIGYSFVCEVTRFQRGNAPTVPKAAAPVRVDVIVSRETVRLWVNRFGRHFSDCIRRDRP